MIRKVSRITDFYSPSAKELSEEEEMLEEFLENEPPSLDQGLVELRQKFTEEEERRRDIESKAAGMLVLNGFFLAFLRFLHQEFVGNDLLILFAFFLFLSILLSLANLVPVAYMTPQLDSILTCTFEEKDEYTRQLYVKYHVAIFNNQKVNERRLRILRWSYYPLVIVALLIAGMLIVGTSQSV